MARIAKRYKKNTEKKVLGIPVCMAAIYVRLSVDSDEKKSESIETQVTLIKEFIQKHNENPNREYEIAVYNIYSDLGKTGTNFDRPGFERMMNDVREGKINCILVNLQMCMRLNLIKGYKMMVYRDEVIIKFNELLDVWELIRIDDGEVLDRKERLVLLINDHDCLK